MEAGLNCSSHCESSTCFIYSGVNNQQGLDILQRLCALSTSGVGVKSRALSPALRAVVWTLLSCGIFLALIFLIFTLRFKNNRIVKMSSPNLNVLTLCGSILTYSSGFLFALEERATLQGTGSRAILQARMWTLCIGSSLVFGPILGKTWRLYKVFTQRMPDKRLIIRDTQLMGLVALLVLVDAAVLTTWSLTDPIKCSRSIHAVVKIMELSASYSLSQLDSCFSLYSDLWVILLYVLKGSLLLYGTYLAGLTSNVSLPPVNQSMTIMGAVCLVTMSTTVAVPVSLYLYAWPNVVYSVVSGAILISTLSINCLLFVPQLTQWRQFEEETNSHPSQMAKYFSSPSKTMSSMYSEDEIYYLLGENDSMKRLIIEKNTIIDSLQEQVNNAKDKLLKLMTVSHPLDDGEMDSSNTNLNSTSTQTTVVSPNSPPTPILTRYSEDAPTVARFLPPYIPPPPIPTSATSQHTTSDSSAAPDVSSSAYVGPPQFQCNSTNESCQVSHWMSNHMSLKGTADESDPTLNIVKNSTSISDGPEEELEMLKKQQDLLLVKSKLVQNSCPPPVDTSASKEQTTASMEVSTTGRQGFVSNKQLVEILQDLSMDAVSSSVRSPERARRPPIDPDHKELNTAVSPPSPLEFFFPTISPYLMRKRRPPFYSSKGGPPPYYFPGSVPPGRRKPPKDHEMLKEDRNYKKNPTSPRPQRQNSRHEGCRRKRVKNTGTRCGSDISTSRRSSIQDNCESFSRKCSVTGQVPQPASADLRQGSKTSEEVYDYSDSDSSSSEDFRYYYRPYCRACLHHPYDSTDSLSSSESEDGELYKSAHPVVNFKVDLKPTFV
ncbi:G-protein coupled receptor 156 [Triplophysa tibetana]|uniref:G-protein coupled receptor 156 n=1 Tax=Triplophysa tibetana TaxID=1572043 RepID=A0A5A9P1Y8_9TELE|nr:G-protein coupled receptor 156 [Triplophysa tibetana]